MWWRSSDLLGEPRVIRTLLWLAVLGGGIYIAARYAAPQIRAWRFEDSMSQSARLSQSASVSEIRNALLESADEFHVPLTSAQLQIHRDRQGHIIITASWEEIVRLEAWRFGEWVDTLRYHYEIQARQEKREP